MISVGDRVKARLHILLSIGLLSTIACSDPAQDVSVMTPTQSDLQPFVDGKTDQFGFDPENIMADDVFQDTGYLTIEQIQTFLEDTPYGRRPASSMP